MKSLIFNLFWNVKPRIFYENLFKFLNYKLKKNQRAIKNWKKGKEKQMKSDGLNIKIIDKLADQLMVVLK